jgi:hypothetical protein
MDMLILMKQIREDGVREHYLLFLRDDYWLRECVFFGHDVA